ncbi:MAG TPA: HAMP domain-containing sensor histidine kinase [Solirubrobacteraceae bacterium]|jgi:two-component system OmpR family sensor kinase
MTSLRARVLASVLVLSAAGLVLLAVVTYAEQRSFLQERVDQEVRGAGPAVSIALDGQKFRQSGNGQAVNGRPPLDGGGAGARRTGTNGAERAGGGDGPRGGPNLNLPPGTYGQRLDASGKVLGHGLLITYGQTTPPTPKIPAHVPVGKLFTVGSAGGSGLRYRAYVRRDPEDSGLTLVAVPLREVDQTLSRLLLVEVLVIVGVLTALGVTAFFVVRLGLRPLDRMEVTAGEIAAGELASGELSRRVSPATSRTEIGRLGLALNAMLERLEQAFAQRQASEDRLRRFLADASHELRTPLSSIRGYAELFRMGATRDGTGTETAMKRIEEESKRMGVLVEDLLTLARLDEQPAITRRLLDLTDLAKDAVEDARATAPERQIELHARAPALVSGDPHQLRQVLANLTRNALVHTPAGTPVEVSVEQDDGHVAVSVRDHGDGLPDASPDQLFDRFWRAEGGRERGRGGAGLGLSIVGTAVEAHGGEVSASNAQGGGALFVVRLPKAAHPASQETPSSA